MTRPDCRRSVGEPPHGELPDSDITAGQSADGQSADCQTADGHTGVCVWRFELRAAPTAADYGLLSPDEAARADALADPMRRAVYVMAHAALRRVLGQATGCDAAAVALVQGWNGKPGLAGGTGPSFSLSHSGRYAVVALSATAALGIDIEATRPRLLARRTAQRFFTPVEAARIDHLTDVKYAHAFVRLWTYKEAFIKATGEGLARRLDSFGIDPEVPCLTHGGPAGDWLLADIAMPPGYLGALAVGTALPLRLTLHDGADPAMPPPAVL